MSEILNHKVVDGIKCFSPLVANEYLAYPDIGFDLTNKCGDSSFWVRSRNRLFKRIVLDHLIPSGKTKLLEIGCGTGGFIQKIVANDNLEITGADIYLKGLHYAQKNLLNVDFIQFDITQGVVGKEFDLIVAFDVIEHIENDVAALSNIRKMLHERGSLIISVPQHMFLWSRLDEIVKHKRRYSRRQLLNKLQESGFDIRYSTSFLVVLFPLMVVSRMFDRGRDRSQSDEKALERWIKFPGVLNWVFDLFMRIDESFIRLGISLPFGGTLVVVAGKR